MRITTYASGTGRQSQTIAALRLAMAFARGQPAFSFQSSGSTGPPKHVSFSRSQLVQVAEATLQVGLNPSSTLVCLSAAMVGGAIGILRAMQFGQHLHLVAPVHNPLHYLAAGTQITLCSMVPLQVEHLFTDPTPKERQLLQGIGTVLVGGAPLSQTLTGRIKASGLGHVFKQTYGMTETASMVAWRSIDSPSEDYILLPNVSAGTDERGCLWVNRPELGQIIQTNDVALYKSHPAPSFSLIGRADFIINSGGVKINPEAVEAAASGLLNGLATVLIGLPHPTLGTCAELVIEGPPLDPETLSQLHHALQRQLPPYHTPKQMHCLERLPRLPSGKLDRLALVQMFSSPA